VLYQFKLNHGSLGSTAPADVAIQLLPHGTGAHQTISLYAKTSGALGLRSTLGFPIGTVAFNRPSSLWGGIHAFVGPRADPFFFDLFQFFKILPDRYYANPRTGDTLGTSTPSFNGFAAGTRSSPGASGYPCSTAASTNALTQINGGFDVVSIVVEVPKALLWHPGSPIMHLWATTSTPDTMSINGRRTFAQIELLSRPAVKELFEVFADHAKTNVREPFDDPTIRNSISTFMTNVAGRSPAIANVVTSVLYPNEIAFDLSQTGPAAYLGVETGGATGGKFGGRGLTDDVIDTSLGVVFGGTIPALKLAPDDGKEDICLTSEHVASGQGGVQTQTTFPYLAKPH
jgi:hypothetical protein